MEYIIILFIYLFGFIFLGTERSKRSNIYYIIECLIMILLWGLRYRVGGDSIRYESYFELLPTIDDIGNYDIGNTRYQPFWLYYNAFIKLICDDFIFFQVIHTSIINIALFIFINNNCKNRFFCVLLYYILYSSYYNTEILREICAVIIFLFSFKFLLKRNYFTYTFFCFIAVMFHISALFLLILPLLLFFYNNEHPIRSLIRLSFLSFIFSLFLTKIIPFDLFSSFLSTSYVDSLENVVRGESSFNFNGILLNIIQQTSVFVPTILLIKLKKEELSKALFLYSLVSIIGIQLFMITRFYNFFFIFLLIAYSDLYLEIKKHKLSSKISYALNLSFIILLFFRILYYNNSTELIVGKMYNCWYPYYSILDPQKDPTREKMIEFQWYY